MSYKFAFLKKKKNGHTNFNIYIDLYIPIFVTE